MFHVVCPEDNYYVWEFAMELTLCLYLLDARYGMSAGSRPAGDQSMYSHSG